MIRLTSCAVGMLGLGLAGMLGVAAVVALAAPGVATAEGREVCDLARAHPAGLLVRCGPQIKSVLLTYDDVRRQMRSDPQGVFHYLCPIEEMCENEPRISGWMIDHARWQGIEHNDASIFELLRQPPIILRGAAKPVDIAGNPLTSTCGVFEVELAGLPTLAVCYDFGESKSTSIVAVASNHEIGFVVLFNQHNADATALREKVRTLLPRFKLERASGDSDLLRWLQ
jgi:hypothetical protein